MTRSYELVEAEPGSPPLDSGTSPVEDSRARLGGQIVNAYAASEAVIDEGGSMPLHGSDAEEVRPHHDPEPATQFAHSFEDVYQHRISKLCEHAGGSGLGFSCCSWKLAFIVVSMASLLLLLVVMFLLVHLQREHIVVPTSPSFTRGRPPLQHSQNRSNETADARTANESADTTVARTPELGNPQSTLCGTRQNPNIFRSKKLMEQNGWEFDWQDGFVFEPADTGRDGAFCKGVAGTSYCGFHYPGDGSIICMHASHLCACMSSHAPVRACMHACSCAVHTCVCSCMNALLRCSGT